MIRVTKKIPHILGNGMIVLIYTKTTILKLIKNIILKIKNILNMTSKLSKRMFF